MGDNLMNSEEKSLVFQNWSQYIITLDRNPMGGKHVVLRFPNKYGASVIQGNGAYASEKEGTFELAVIDFSEDERGKITYNTPITDDVVGHATASEIRQIFTQIYNLPMKGDIVDGEIVSG